MDTSSTNATSTAAATATASPTLTPHTLVSRPPEFSNSSNTNDNLYKRFLNLHTQLPPTVQTISCVFSIFLVMFLSALDQTIIVTIIPELSREFSSSIDSSWIISGYMLPVAVLSLIWGRIGFLFGLKMSTVISIFIFEVGSLITALSHSELQLILGRVVAGIGGSGITTLVYLIINDISTMRTRSWFMNIVTLAFTVSSGVGPLIGGAFTGNSTLTWRWCFYINLPIGGFALVLLILTYHERHNKNTDKVNNNAGRNETFKSFVSHKFWRSLDPIGFFLITAGTTLILLALSFGNQKPWKSAKVIACFIVGGLALIVYIYYDTRIFKASCTNRQYPLLPQFTLSVISSCLFLFFSEFVFIISCVYLSNNLQYIQGHSAWKTGVFLLPMIIAITIASTVTAYLITATKYIKPYGVIGAILSPLASGLLSLIWRKSSVANQLGLQILAGISFGMTLQPGMLTAQVAVSKKDDNKDNGDQMNVVTSFLAFFRGLGAAMGSIIGGIIFDSVMINSLTKKQKSGQVPTLGISASDILNIVSGDNGVDVPNFEMETYLKCVEVGYKVLMFCCIGFGAVELIMGFLMSGHKVPGDDEVEIDDIDQINQGEKAYDENGNEIKNV